MSDIIDSFRGEYEFLSNFYPSLLIVDGQPYSTIEHAFQAAKTDDPVLRENIRTASTPRDAKKLGRSVPLVADWDQKRLDVMASLVQQKFQDHRDLKLRLLFTGKKVLVEGNTWKDQFWGVTKDGDGKNHLGTILMKVRDQIRASEGSFLQVLRKHLESEGLGFVADVIDKSHDLNKSIATNLVNDPLADELKQFLELVEGVSP